MEHLYVKAHFIIRAIRNLMKLLESRFLVHKKLYRKTRCKCDFPSREPWKKPACENSTISGHPEIIIIYYEIIINQFCWKTIIGTKIKILHRLVWEKVLRRQKIFLRKELTLFKNVCNMTRERDQLPILFFLTVLLVPMRMWMLTYRLVCEKETTL